MPLGELERGQGQVPAGLLRCWSRRRIGRADGGDVVVSMLCFRGGVWARPGIAGAAGTGSACG